MENQKLKQEKEDRIKNLDFLINDAKTIYGLIKRTMLSDTQRLKQIKNFWRIL